MLDASFAPTWPDDPVSGTAHAAVWPRGVPHALQVPDEPLWQVLHQRARRQPQAVGLHFLGRDWTWAALDDAAARLAGGLRQLGVSHGDRVLLWMQNCPQFVIAFHAVLRLGAVVVPANPMVKAEELHRIVADADIRVAVAAADLLPELLHTQSLLPAGTGLSDVVTFAMRDALPEDAADHAAGWPPAWRDWLLATPAWPDPPLGLRWHAWARLLRQPAAEPAAGRAADLALLAYTSGTTGLPKGCMHPHRTLRHNALSAGPWLGLREGDAQLVVVPLFHITGLVMGMLAAIDHGARIVLLPRWDRTMAARAIAAQRVSHWPNIPTMVLDLLAAPEVASFDLSSLRYIGGGGAPMPEAVSARLAEQYGLRYLEGYGLTETAAPTHTNPPGAERPRCLGIPYIGTRARVVDPATRQPLPVGEIGEILVSGPQVFAGYWQQPAATAEAFVDVDGRRWLRTGDLGRVDDEGYFHLADRLKRMINASGFKVWPAEVEASLMHHPAVQEACVVRCGDPYRGESVKTVVVLKPGQMLDEAGLMAWARERMAAYKVPREVEFVESLPRSATGKVMWRELQAVEDEREARAAEGRRRP